MKRGTVILLAAVMCMLLCSALADDYGKAIIVGRSGYKVHLREEPSADSDSMGVYFTGTQVKCESDPNAEWVAVKIGRERGYMRSGYLKRGEAADYVTPQFWTGTVTATNYARLRAGPSTEYQLYGTVKTGENVTIMGETDKHWYYVEYKGEKGFMSANLIYTGKMPSGSSAYTQEYMSEYANTSGWRAAYRTYLLEHADSSDTFALIYVNDDSVPELVIDSGVEAEGCQILTYSAGQVNVLKTRRLGFTYIERGNRLCNSDGIMDHYFDDVYEIRNGRWACIARGEYFGYLSGWNDILQRYVCRYYRWNGRNTDISQYMKNLGEIYNSQRAVGVEEGYSKEGILWLIAQMR